MKNNGIIELIMRIWAWIKGIYNDLFEEEEIKNNIPKVLPNNVVYADWIDSIERQIEQLKIDYALGWITKETYERRMDEFRAKVRYISKSYINYLKLNNVSIPKEIKLQFC